MSGNALTHDWPQPVEILNPAGVSPFVLTCEHASNHMPKEYAALGLPEAELRRHIAWDIGAADVTRHLSQLLDAPAFLSGYSRLLIDLNRPLVAPSSIPAISETTRIAANEAISADERMRRADLMFHPFHDTVSEHLDQRRDDGRPAIIIAVHSFTPVFKGFARPWHAGILFSHSEASGQALVKALGRDPDLVVAANEPYVITREEDYTVPVHGEDRGLDAVLIEIRQDLLETPEGCALWARRLHAALASAFSG